MNVNFNTEKNIIAEKYEALSIVGRGRNSVVYKAKCDAGTAAGKLVALKILPLTEKKSLILRSRMKRESLAMLSSKHNNVIKLYDYVLDNENCILVMEYADSGDLRQLLEKTNAALPLDLALDFIIQTLQGLEHLHSKGIIHRDIKPDNLLLVNNHIIKIADFSVADIPMAEFRQGTTDYSKAVGTVDYVAPEAFNNGNSTEQSDIFSVGVSFYQLITNKLPFEAESFSDHIALKLSGVYKPASKVNPDLPKEIDRIIAKAMAINPINRYKTPREFVDALELYRSNIRKDEIFDLDKFKIKSSFGNPNLLLDEDSVEEEIYREKKNINSATPASLNFSKNKRLIKTLTTSALCILFVSGVAFSYFMFNFKNSQKNESAKATDTKSDLEENNSNSTLEMQIDNSSAKVEQVAAAVDSSVFVNLATNNYMGTFKKLYADGTDVMFSCGPNANSSKLLLQVPLAGWENVEIDLAELTKNKSIVLDKAGMKIELNFENAKTAEGNTIIAKYTDLLSGKSGEVVFK